MQQLGLWNDAVRTNIVANEGSVQHLDVAPSMKGLYKTVWEVKQRALVDLNVDRTPWIDQSISSNYYMESPTSSKLSSLLFYAWKKGVKTGSYYIRSRAASSAIKFTLDTPLASPPGTPPLPEHSGAEGKVCMLRSRSPSAVSDGSSSTECLVCSS